jgi:hypothetical protein
MKELKKTKYRFIFSLNEQDFAFEKLFVEMISIDSKFSDDSASINRAKRKLFLKILLAYCNHNNSYADATVPISVAAVDPPHSQAHALPATPSPNKLKQLEVEIEVTPPSGLRKSDSRIHFGDLKIDIE